MSDTEERIADHRGDADKMVPPTTAAAGSDDMPDWVAKLVNRIRKWNALEPYPRSDPSALVIFLADDRKRLLAALEITTGEAERQYAHNVGQIAEIEKLHSAVRWQPVETAPKDGTHILACNATEKYDSWLTFNQRPPTVVHYWSHPGEEGYYTSVTEIAPEHPFRATHWMKLPEPPIPDSESVL